MQTESSVERYSKVITVFYGIIILIIYCKRERERHVNGVVFWQPIIIITIVCIEVVKLLKNYFNCSVEAGSHLQNQSSVECIYFSVWKTHLGYYGLRGVICQAKTSGTRNNQHCRRNQVHHLSRHCQKTYCEKLIKSFYKKSFRFFPVQTKISSIYFVQHF